MARRKRRNRTFWTGWSSRARMHFVLAICCALVLLTVVIALLVVHSLAAPGAQTQGTAAASEPLVEDASYNKDENTIDTAQYASTILEESEDAGQEYIDETLFLGDSNTARMYRMFDYCSYDNAIGSVGMSARSLATYACVQFSGYSNYKTMPEAVALMQPQRVILTFGTNDLSPSYSTEDFIANYEEGIQAIVEAYPSVDIIVNSIPPLGQQHSNQSLTQTQVDEYNAGLVAMCEENGWKFLNSAETLKDPDTGYAKSGYVEASDGIHLTSAAMDALFSYIRTHSYIMEDDRPTLTAIPEHIGDKDVSAGTAATVTNQNTTSSSSTTATQAPASPTATPEPNYTYWDEVVEPTCTEQGYTIHHCDQDSSRDYTDSYTDPLGHTEPDANGYCTRCQTLIVTITPTPVPSPSPTPAPTPAPTEAPIPAPTEPPAPTEAPAVSEPTEDAPPAESGSESSSDAQSQPAETA